MSDKSKNAFDEVSRTKPEFIAPIVNGKALITPPEEKFDEIWKKLTSKNDGTEDIEKKFANIRFK